MSQAIVDAKSRRLVARGVHWGVAVGESQADVGRGVDVGVARVRVAPPRAAGALGRDLPVGGVDVRSRLQNGVGRVRVGRRAEVAAVGRELLAIGHA